MIPFTVKDDDGFRYTVLDSFTNSEGFRIYILASLGKSKDKDKGQIFMTSMLSMYKFCNMKQLCPYEIYNDEDVIERSWG